MQATSLAEASGAARRSTSVALRVQRLLAHVGRWFEFSLIAICALLLCFLVASVFYEVLIRYVVHAPQAWTEEVAQFILVWFGLLAAAVSARRGMHFAIRYGVIFLSDRTRWLIRQGVNLAIVLLLGILFYRAVLYLDIVGNQSAMATGVNMRVPYAGVPVGLAAVMLVYVLELADAVLSLWTGRSFSSVEAREEAVHRELKGESVPEAPAGAVAQPH